VLAARIELRKVVWPERDETVKTTYVVFGFAIVMAVFLLLDWVSLSDSIAGRSNG